MLKGISEKKAVLELPFKEEEPTASHNFIGHPSAAVFLHSGVVNRCYGVRWSEGERRKKQRQFVCEGEETHSIAQHFESQTHS